MVSQALSSRTVALARNHFQFTGSSKSSPTRTALTVRALNDAGSKVWVVLQLPSHDAPVAKRLVRSTLFGADSGSWQRTFDEHLRRTEVMLEVERLSKGLDVRFLDPAPLFYDPLTRRYRVEKNREALYYDQVHITITTALKVIAPWLRAAVEKNFALETELGKSASDR